MDEMIEEGEKDIAENYQDDRPILKKLKDAVVNKIYPQDYRTRKEIESDLEEFEKIHARRARFTVFDSTANRFKVLQTVGDPSVAIRGTGRLRTSGDLYKRTESGYGRERNLRNANFSDLDIY